MFRISAGRRKNRKWGGEPGILVRVLSVVVEQIKSAKKSRLSVQAWDL